MTDRKKVIKALECCKDINKLNCDDCAYTYNARSDRCECTAEEQEIKRTAWAFRQINVSLLDRLEQQDDEA